MQFPVRAPKLRKRTVLEITFIDGDKRDRMFSTWNWNSPLAFLCCVSMESLHSKKQLQGILLCLGNFGSWSILAQERTYLVFIPCVFWIGVRGFTRSSDCELTFLLRGVDPNVVVSVKWVLDMKTVILSWGGGGERWWQSPYSDCTYIWVSSVQAPDRLGWREKITFKQFDRRTCSQTHRHAHTHTCAHTCTQTRIHRDKETQAHRQTT